MPLLKSVLCDISKNRDPVTGIPCQHHIFSDDIQLNLKGIQPDVYTNSYPRHLRYSGIFLKLLMNCSVLESFHTVNTILNHILYRTL